MISDSDRPKLKVGYKQTSRALSENTAKKVFITLDSEERFSETIRTLCEKNNVPFETVETRRGLGEMCGIDVGASCAVIVK